MNDKQKKTNQDTEPTNEAAPHADITKWLIIGGAVIAGLLLLRLVLSLNDGSAQATPTPAPPINTIIAPFVGPTWEWTSSTDAAGTTTTVSNPAQYTIQFLANGTYQGKADCNTLSGTYAVNGSALFISPGVSSLVACPPGSLANQFTAQLFNVESFVMQGTDLTFKLKNNAGTMTLHQSGAPNNSAVLIGPTWKWRQSVSSSVTQSVPDPNQYTLQFFANGTIQVQADCNQGSGIYSAGSTTLTIQVQQMTRAACPPGSLSDQFVQQLNSAASYFTSGADLVIQLRDSSQMMFGSGTFPTAVPPATIVTTTPLPTLAPATITPTPPPACAGAPVISSFTADPPTIAQGQKSTLRWGVVTNATSVSIDHGIGNVAAPGSIIVAPGQTTTYLLTAIGCGGQAQFGVTITVLAPTAPPTAVPTQVPPTAVPTIPPTAVPTQPPPTEKPTEAPPATPTTQPGANLLGTWQWTGAIMNDGTNLTPSNPSQYTAQFQNGGALAVRADCNNASGTYTTDGQTLTIQLPVVTGALCSPESLSQQFISLLQQAGNYTVNGNNLIIQLKADSGSMTFTK